MTEKLIEKARILYQQKRYKESAKIFADLVGKEPTNVYLLGMYSDVLRAINNNKEAEEMINRAIGLSPEADSLHYTKALVMLSLDRYDEAENCIDRAIQINPQDADYFAAWASVKLERKQFEKALQLADKSLELDPGNILGLNTRSSAQLKLNKKEESRNTIEGALREDPNNAFTHANYGWNLLEKGEHKQSLKHFSEALKIDPGFANAQVGMIQALKARYILYKWFLKYALWMGNLTAKYQWAVIIGFYLLFRVLNGIAESNPPLKPFLTPILIIMGIMALSTWIIGPVSNLFLRLNMYGRHLLKKHEILSSNFVGISGVIFFLGIISYIITGDIRWLPIAVFGLAMMIPLSQVFDPSKSKVTLWIYTGLLTLFGIAAILTTFKSGRIDNIFATIFLFGFIAFQWIANYVSIKESNK